MNWNEIEEATKNLSKRTPMKDFLKYVIIPSLVILAIIINIDAFLLTRGSKHGLGVGDRIIRGVTGI